MPFFAAIPGVLLLLALIYFSWKLGAKGTCWNKVFWPALLFKLSCGILLGLFYPSEFDTHKYQAASEMMTEVGMKDAAKYFQTLVLNTDKYLPAAFLDFKFRTYSNSFFFVKILSLLNFLTGSLYYLNALLLSWFSFVGCWVLTRSLDRYFAGTANAAIFSFLFFPSIVFWTSGVLKESVLTGLLGFFWAAALQLHARNLRGNWSAWLLLIGSAYVLWKIKFFVAAFVFGITVLWLLVSWMRQRFAFMRRPIFIFGALAGLGTMVAIAISQLHENFNLQFFLDRLVWNYQVLEQRSIGKPHINFSSFEPNFASVFRNIPEAFGSVLYRPFVWEGNSMLYKLAGFENLFLLILSIFVLLSLPEILKRQLNGFYIMLLVFGLVLAITFALATPNLGSLNRYRVTFLPLLLYMAWQAPVWQALLARFRRLRKLDSGS